MAPYVFTGVASDAAAAGAALKCAPARSPVAPLRVLWSAGVTAAIANRVASAQAPIPAQTAPIFFMV